MEERDPFDEMMDDLGPEQSGRWPPNDDKEREGTSAPPANNDIVTEDSAAQEFASRYADRLLHDHDSGRWLKYSGTAWVPNRDRTPFQWARLLARELIADESPKARFIASKVAFARGVETFAKCDPIFAVTSEVFDADPWLLGTPAGTVDLRTGKLHLSNPDDRITKLTAIGPATLPDCPTWLRFLDEATGGDAGLIRFLKQWCGYSLTGITREHALVFVYGPGGNGKSVFLNVVTALMGDYATTAAMDTFTASKNDKHPTDMAMLRGARLVTASETEEDRAWAEARIKQLTGGDAVTARFMRQDFFTFTPTFKLTVVGNHQPMLRSVDEAARRRFNIVPFIRKPERPDRELEAKLKAEWAGILRWMIEGCLDWQMNGLVRPPSVVEATESYFSEQDLMGQWLAEKCDIREGDPNVWDRTTDLFESWSAYAKAAGDAPGTVKAFAPAMRRKGFPQFRKEHARGFSGIRLKPDRSYGQDDA